MVKYAHLSIAALANLIDMNQRLADVRTAALPEVPSVHDEFDPILDCLERSRQGLLELYEIRVKENNP